MPGNRLNAPSRSSIRWHKPQGGSDLQTGSKADYLKALSEFENELYAYKGKNTECTPTSMISRIRQHQKPL
jgi:hypothetical protein